MNAALANQLRTNQSVKKTDERSETYTFLKTFSTIIRFNG